LVLLEELDITWTFLFDSLTGVMLIVVFVVSFCAHVYSIEYMNEDMYQTSLCHIYHYLLFL